MKALLLAALICFAASTDICADIAGNYDVEYTLWGSNGPYGKVSQSFFGTGSVSLNGTTASLTASWTTCSSSNATAYPCSVERSGDFSGSCEGVFVMLNAKGSSDNGVWTFQYLGNNGPDTLTLVPASEQFSGTCKSDSAANACGECENDLNCGGSTDSCWAEEDYWCTHENPVTGAHYCNANSPVNSCQQVCTDDAQCGGQAGSWTYCWGQLDHNCDDVPVETTLTITGFFDYDTMPANWRQDCTMPTPLTSLTPNSSVLIQFDGIVSWTAPYMSQLHWGNVISDSLTYTGCGAATEAYYVIADVPLAYDLIRVGDELNVFLEQWTIGGSKGPIAVFPVEFSNNATVTIDYS